jgi:hypothetical protein
MNDTPRGISWTFTHPDECPQALRTQRETFRQAFDFIEKKTQILMDFPTREQRQGRRKNGRWIDHLAAASVSNRYRVFPRPHFATRETADQDLPSPAR